MNFLPFSFDDLKKILNFEPDLYETNRSVFLILKNRYFYNHGRIKKEKCSGHE